jgi:hypothetical protein
MKVKYFEIPFKKGAEASSDIETAEHGTSSD